MAQPPVLKRRPPPLIPLIMPKLTSELTPTTPKLDPSKPSANQIIRGLFLGNAAFATNPELMKDFTHILNVTQNETLLNVTHNEIKKVVLQLPILDQVNVNIADYFDEAIRFICEALSNGGRVLVHCQAGVSRSATIVIAFLIHQFNLTDVDATAYVKERRPVIRPNFGFCAQLFVFHRDLIQPEPPRLPFSLEEFKKTSAFLPTHSPSTIASPICSPTTIPSIRSPTTIVS